MSKTLHGTKSFEEIHSYFEVNAGIDEHQSAQPLLALQKYDSLWGYRRLPYSRQKVIFSRDFQDIIDLM